MQIKTRVHHSMGVMRSIKACCLMALLLAFALAGIQSWAQATQGSILGTVKDSKGAVIPGALVTEAANTPFWMPRPRIIRF